MAFDTAMGRSALPASIQSLFAARMERLEEADRTVLNAAAVMGRRIAPQVLAMALFGDAPWGGVQTQAALSRLQAHDVVCREDHTQEYVFKHALLRECVYLSLL